MTPLEAAALALAVDMQLNPKKWDDLDLIRRAYFKLHARTAISAYLKACAEDASAVARVRAAIKAPGEPDIDTDVAWYESRVHAVLSALEPKE